MTLPYDSALFKAHVPGGTAAWINRDLGPIDTNQRASGPFTGAPHQEGMT